MHLIPPSIFILGLLHSLPHAAFLRRRHFTKTRRIRLSKYRPHQGGQEKARRVRQMAEGKLKSENGLETA